MSPPPPLPASPPHGDSTPKPKASITEHFTPSSLASSPHYHAMSITTIAGPSKMLHMAGQIGRDGDGVLAASYLEQVRLALANLRACLASQGATPRDLVKLTYYIVDYDPAARAHAELLYDFLGDARPPATLIPVQKLALPGLLFEVDAVAVVSLE
ncbi:flavin-containing amine [Phlyctema vagabunda]|uniref:Flavin-containing amine n=1 Tax=Phlyctema vagabunda TaxID=108571 RepID=A0ABR4PGU8_9HELO